MAVRLHRATTPGVGQDGSLPVEARHGPLASVGTIYEMADGRRCIVTFANGGTDALRPVRNRLGELWVGYLLDDDVEPERFDDWERAWIPAELLRPVSDLSRRC